MDDIDDFPELPPGAFEELEREIPLLFGVRRLSDGLTQMPWFAHLGEPPTDAVRQTADLYLDRLGFPDAELAILPTPDDAAAAAETLDWASPAWESEELARAEITGRALEVVSEEALEVAIRMITARAGEAAKESMAEEGAIWDIGEEAIKNIAVGAAVQCSVNAGLVVLASEADPDIEVVEHLFTHKLKLFELGRWPVSVVGQSFSLF